MAARSPAAQLALAAFALAVPFTLFVIALPLWLGQPSRPPAADPSPTSPGDPSGLVLALAFALVICLPFRPYHLAQRLVRRAAVPTPVLLALTAAVGIAPLLIYPAFGSDIFDYAGFERMWVAYGDNPLLALPINHPQDWLTQYVWYPDRTPAYGPLWAILTWPILRLAGDSATGIVIGYKLLSICAFAACCWLVWVNVEANRRQRALVAFAWSPLILFEVLAKVHNDVLPALAMLCAVWLAGRSRNAVFSLAAGVAGGLVKITALAAAPPVVVFLWRRAGWRMALLATVLALLLVVAVYAPFWQGIQSLMSIWNQTSRVIWSPASVLIVASNWLPGGPYPTPVRVLLGLVWLGTSAAVVLRRRLARPDDLATASGWMLLISVLLLTSAVYGHYLVPAVALAAISDDWLLRRLVFWLSIGGVAAYTVQLLGLTFGSAWLDSDQYRVLGTLVLLAPAILMLALSILSKSRAANSSTAGRRLDADELTMAGPPGSRRNDRLGVSEE